MGLSHANARRAMKALWNAPLQPEIPFLIGGPGVGKSHTLRDAGLEHFHLKDSGADFIPTAQESVEVELGLGGLLTGTLIEGKSPLTGEKEQASIITFSCAVTERCDWLMPFPDVEAGITRFLPSEYIPTKGRGLLAIEEVPQGPQEVQKSLMAIIDRAMVRALGEGWVIGMTGNRPQDRAGATTVISSIRDRVCFVQLGNHTGDDFQTGKPDEFKGEWHFDAEQWVQWALTKGIHPYVCSFVKAHPQYLYQFSPEALASPTLRSWAKVGNLFHSCPTDLRREVFKGYLGSGMTNAFLTYLEITEKLPDPEVILSNPEHAPILDRVDMAWALCCAIASRVVAKPERAEAAFTYACRLPGDFSAFLGREVYTAAKGGLSAHKSWRTWLTKHGKALQAANVS